jgi:uncharacterized damage-inducible protein DinB
MSAEVVGSLRANLEELVELVGSMPAERLERSEGEGWSARQVLAHLADFELMAAVRVRMVLSKERAPLAGYGQAEFTDRFAGLETPAEALERFAVNRRATLRVLEALEPGDWERTGVHPVRGEEPLRTTAENVVRHDRSHLDQLREAAGT